MSVQREAAWSCLPLLNCGRLHLFFVVYVLAIAFLFFFLLSCSVFLAGAHLVVKVGPRDLFVLRRVFLFWRKMVETLPTPFFFSVVACLHLTSLGERWESFFGSSLYQ